MPIMESKEPLERLYLYKDKKHDIFVDLRELLPQHQKDGVRFLFRQFKKKKPGVILNDPSGYGKCAQLVLFLTAVRDLLKHGKILIITSKCSQDYYKEHFERWAHCFDDFSKLIYVVNVDGLDAMYRREWDMVVVHGCTADKALLRTHIKADFKIWITSVDMKENLDTFSSIYEWLHPKSKFDFQDFVADKSNFKEVINKSIILDAFLEDIVLRRSGLLTPFTMSLHRKISKSEIVESPKKVKNKDSTGTKVKRSRKRKVEDNYDLVDTSGSKSNAAAVNDNIASTAHSNFDTNTDDLFNFEDSKTTDNKRLVREIPINSDSIDVIKSHENKIDSINDDAITDTETADFCNALNDIVRNENIGENDLLKNPNVSLNISSTNMLKANVSEEIMKNSNDAYDFDTQKIVGDHLNLKKIEENDIIYINKSCRSNGNHDFKKEDLTEDIVDDNTEIVKHGNIKMVSQDIFESEDCYGDSKCDSSVKTDNINSNSIDDFDSKMLEWEEKAKKKFQGSLLDRLF